MLQNFNMHTSSAMLRDTGLAFDIPSLSFFLLITTNGTDLITLLSSWLFRTWKL